MTRISRSLAGLIARDAELVALAAGLDDARQGAGCIRVVSGRAGMGKTRLARELVGRAEARGCAVLWGGCSELELALPFLPFNEAIDTYLATADVGHLRRQLGRLAESVGAIVPQLSSGAPVLNYLSDAAVQLQLFEGVVAVLRTLAAQSGAVVVIDDVHWADASTRELLDFVARRIRGLPVLLVVTYRPEEVNATPPLRVMLDGWRRAGLATEMKLPPLQRDEVHRLVCARLGAEGVSSGLVDLLVHRSEGVPFAVEELLDEAIILGHVFERDGLWQHSAASRLELPHSLAVGILRRLDRLELVHQRVVKGAAVLGTTFDPGVLCEVVELPPTVVSAALDAAIRAQLVESDTADLSRLRFRHALTHEAVRDTVLAWDAINLHSRAAEVLATAIPPVPLIERARHLLAAGRAVDAAPLSAQAATTAARAGAFAEAAMLYGHALVNVVDPVERGQLLCERGRMLLASGDPAAAIASLHEGVGLLEPTAHASTAKLLTVLGFAHFLLGESPAALDAFERARSILESAPPSPDLALLYARLAMWHDSNLECETGLAWADRALALAEDLEADHARAAALIYRGSALCDLGRRDEGFGCLDRGLDEAMRLVLTEDLFVGIAVSAWQRALAMRARELSSLADLIRGRANALNVGLGPEVFASCVEALAGRFLGDVRQTEAAALAMLNGCRTAPKGLLAFLGHELLAWVRLRQGCPAEAEAILEDVGPQQNWLRRISDPIWVELAMATHGDPDAPATAARDLLAEVPVLAADPLVASIVVPALLAAGAEAEARHCVSAALGPDRNPMAVGAAADLAAYRGDTNKAAALYREAAEGASAAGYRSIAAGYLERVAEDTGPPPVVALTNDRYPTHSLSRRELELLALLAHGKTDQQIAQTLLISLPTVRSYLARIRDKTGYRRRPQLTRLAIELGLLEDRNVRNNYAVGPQHRPGPVETRTESPARSQK